MRERRSSADGFEVKLSTIAAPVPDDSIQDLMEKMESKRAGTEKSVFDQVSCSMAVFGFLGRWNWLRI